MCRHPVIVNAILADAGGVFSNTVASIGKLRRYRSMERWRGMGISRDMVFELSSTADMVGALNGAYVDPLAGELTYREHPGIYSELLRA